MKTNPETLCAEFEHIKKETFLARSLTRTYLIKIIFTLDGAHLIIEEAF